MYSGISLNVQKRPLDQLLLLTAEHQLAARCTNVCLLQGWHQFILGSYTLRSSTLPFSVPAAWRGTMIDLSMLSAVVAGLTAVILAWMLMTKVPGPMFLLPFVGESVSFFASPLKYACSR